MVIMPSKKRKYNARFPAGRIKKIMQTDEEVGKVAQAVPIIISRTLELFVESLLGKALQVTLNRNAKTLSPSHVKQCILGESRFDFLRDLVKNIPDVSAAEEKELMSAESSPTSSRFSEASTQSNCESRVQTTPPQTPKERNLKRAVSTETEIPNKTIKIEPLALTAPPRTEPYFQVVRTEPSSTMPKAIDLTKRPVRTANFYQETLVDEVQHKSVIKLNPIYSSPQPSTSYTNLNPVPALHKIEIPVPKPSSVPRTPNAPRTPITPLINIDFSRSLSIPEIKVLDTAGVVPKEPKVKVSRQNSKSKIDVKKIEIKLPPPAPPVDIDVLNSGNLQIDEDYDT